MGSFDDGEVTLQRTMDDYDLHVEVGVDVLVTLHSFFKASFILVTNCASRESGARNVRLVDYVGGMGSPLNVLNFFDKLQGEF